MFGELEPGISPIVIARSLVIMQSRPEDRKPDEIRGYYFDFFVEPNEYPGGAAVAVQWTFQEGAIATEVVHASDWAEHMMELAGRDLRMLPDVSELLFNALKREYYRGE